MGKESCELIDKILADHERVETIVADEGYRGTFVDHVEKKWNRKVEISKGVKKGFAVIPKRWVVELLGSMGIGY
ncbi:MAG: hypothetical protein GKR87_16270 [Kiritimatiellae bacterium]|nr:hypothetical protein [Kiritimatiellia bacterium]